MGQNRRLFFRRWSIVPALLLALFAISLGQAQSQPIFRIGVLDDAGGSLTQGTQLAVNGINEEGGVVGADGTIFQLQVVQQSPDDLELAVSNFNQADVIAVIGPETSDTLLGNRDVLAQLNVPLLTTGTDDTLITNDASNRVLRLVAAEAVQARALANYLINQQNAASLVTIQLDLESTASRISFSQAATQQGLAPSQEFILSDDTTLERIVLEVVNQMPQFAVIYGPPEVAASLYTSLRESDFPGGVVYNRANSPTFRDAVPTELLDGVYDASTWSYTFTDARSQTFVLAYIRAFGELPSPEAAAAYDGIFLLRNAIGNPGTLLNNLLAIRSFDGIQGVLNPALLNTGETSTNVAITQLGDFGAPAAVARYANNTIVEVVPDDTSPITITTATPLPTSTPAPTNTPFPTATPDGVILTIQSRVQNVRSGPGLNYAIIGQLSQGETARVIGATIDFSWVAISFRGTTGWLSRSILEVTGNTNTVPILTPPPSPTPLPATPTPTAQPIPDIVVVSAAPTRLTIGVPFSVNAVVRNQGGAAAGPFAVAASFTPGDVFSAVNLTGLAAGTSTNITLTGTLSGQTGPQNPTIVADLNNQVNEGTAGEANNGAFLFNYIADAPLLTGAQATGTITLQETQTFSLDGGAAAADIQWGGGGLVPLGSTRLVQLNNFNSFDQVHRDAIATSNLQNIPINPVQAGTLIGVLTDGGTKHGVLQITQAQPGVSITFNYRMYDS